MPLILLPNFLHPEAQESFCLPQQVREIVAKLDGCIAESPKEGRAFLKRMGRAPSEVPQSQLNEHTTPEELEQLLAPMKKGEVWAYVSDAGVPCLADPGAQLVAKARAHNIPVQAISGPSSVVLMLMLSGLNAQNFAFHGYLPRDANDLTKTIKTMEKRTREEKQTQVFIETPYRNEKLLTTLLSTLSPNLLLCVASDLTGPNEWIATRTVANWKQSSLPSLKDRPTIFALSVY